MNTGAPTKEYVLTEVARLQYLYILKNQIRYGQQRTETKSESVAEHVFGMHILAQYFLPLLDTDNTWDRARIYEMITLHDIDEIETGDVIGYLKSKEERQRQSGIVQQVIEKSPEHMQPFMNERTDEYEKQESVESQFVKALDKFEPLLQIYSETGKQILKSKGTTATQSASIKDPYIIAFPLMYQYYQIIHQAMIDEGFFS